MNFHCFQKAPEIGPNLGVRLIHKELHGCVRYAALLRTLPLPGSYPDVIVVAAI